MHNSERFLAAYAGVLTLAFAAVVLTGASASRNAKFEQIDVQRINVREADGTLRMVVSNRASFPGAIFKGKEYPHERGVAGLLFYNDEGTEDGGLVFAGAKAANGKVDAGGHLSFDQYDQDQVVALTQTEGGGKRYAGLYVNDVPDASLEPLAAAMPGLKGLSEAEFLKRVAELQGGKTGAPRVFVGKNRERDSLVEMKDADGKTRLRLQVGANGDATIQFLDADGKVVRALKPESPDNKQ